MKKLTRYPAQEQNQFASSLLQPADILLVHKKHSLWSRLISWATHCYWNHALIVYSACNPKQGSDSPLVIDAKTDGSIALGRASYFLEQPDKFDIAIKRLDFDWFQQDSLLNETGIRNHVCNIAANEVELGIGSKIGDMFRQITRQITLILRFIKRKLLGPTPPPKIPWNIRLNDLKFFTCGGFVQWCYYKAIAKKVEEQQIDNSKLREVLFNPRIDGKVTPFELLMTTPADLANSVKLSWKYIIRNGEISEFPDSMVTSQIRI